MQRNGFKGQLRTQVWGKLGYWRRIPPFEGQEAAAKQLGRLEPYVAAKRVFAPPDRALYHARLEVLKDGKQLVMATPGIRDGFYELTQRVKRELWPTAVRTREVGRYGRRLETTHECVGRIDLMLTGAVAVSEENGARIGKGTGYGDLEYGILYEIESMDEETPIVALVHDSQVFPRAFSCEPKDVPTDWILTPTRIIKVNKTAHRPKRLDWSYIQKHRKNFMAMRPIRGLWDLRSSSAGCQQSQGA